MLPPDLTAALADRYVLQRELGQGGMATVYLATDVRHQRRVAVKVLHQDVAVAMGVERFLKEIQLTAALQHPHLLALFDSGVADGRVFYVMPFVEGETLRARLNRERQLPVADALRLTSEVASALAYAHKRGIVHRDIKPENVLLQDSSALVADFGIALAAVGAADNTRLTQSGLSLGTPQYMSPEQAMGERTVDARSDLFALGAMAYEMLAGEPPFSGPSVQAIVAKVLTSTPVALGDLRRSVPEHAASAIMAALEKLPADRPATADQFVQMLSGTAPAPVGRTSGGQSASRPTRMRRFAPWAIGLTMGVAAGAIVARWLPASAPDVPGSAAAGGETRFLLGAPDSLEMQAVCCGQMFALSPDGKRLVFQARPVLRDSSRAGTPQSLFVRELDRVATRQLPNTARAVSLSISPDGTQIAYTVEQRLYRVAISGDDPVEVATLPSGYIGGTAWRGMDRLLVAVGLSLYEVALRDGQVQRLLPADADDRQVVGVSVIGTTNTALFSYVAYDGRPEVHALVDGDSVAKRIMPGASPRYVAAWKALVVNRNGRMLAFPFDPQQLDTLGPPVLLADGITLRSPVLGHAEYATADNGTFVTTLRREGDQVGWVPSNFLSLRRNGVASQIAPALGLVGAGGRFSDDSRRLLFTGRREGQETGIFTYDLTRNALQSIPESSGPDNAAFTDHADSILFSVRRSTQFRIRAADGSGAVRALPPITGWRRVDDVSVRGDIIVFGGAPAAGEVSSDLGYVSRTRGGAVTPFIATPADESEPALSPDGKWLAFTSTATGRQEVYVSPFPSASSTTMVSTAGGRQAVWDAGGTHLTFVNEDGGFEEVPFRAGATPTLGPSRIIYRRGFVRYFTRSPDGAALLLLDTSRLLRLLGLEVVVGYRPRF